MSLLTKSHLFIFSNFFDFRSIEEKGKDVQTDFFYIEKKFYNCISTSHNNGELKQKIISNKKIPLFFTLVWNKKQKIKLILFYLILKIKIILN